MKKIIQYGLLSISLLFTSCANSKLIPKSISPIQPLIIAHRGASGLLPEETLKAYELAIDLGADYIELDLVSTLDGVLIARHENEISKTTDVALKFPERKKTKDIDGEKITGWFTEDFTLKEIKSLKVIERLPGRDHSHDGKLEIATFDEIISLLRKKEKEKNRVIGLYPETKHPTYFSKINLPLEEKLISTLNHFGYKNKEDAIFIQSFESTSLKKLHLLGPYKLVLLLNSPELLNNEKLLEIRQYADAIGPHKLIIQKDPLLVEKAHKMGLLVHPYTFRSDSPFLDPKYEGDPIKEYLEYFKIGVDGVFSDFTETALEARNIFSHILH